MFVDLTNLSPTPFQDISGVSNASFGRFALGLYQRRVFNLNFCNQSVISKYSRDLQDWHDSALPPPSDRYICGFSHHAALLWKFVGGFSSCSFWNDISWILHQILLYFGEIFTECFWNRGESEKKKKLKKPALETKDTAESQCILQKHTVTPHTTQANFRKNDAFCCIGETLEGKVVR